MNTFLSHLFTRRKPLWPGMTDIHTHLLPGVDDGFSSEKESLEMLSFLETCGIKRIFLTPHVMADLPKNRKKYLLEQFETFHENSAHIDIDLHLAAEYMLDECFYNRMKEGLLSYDGKHVLVEVSCLHAPYDFFEKLYDIQLNGFIPVLAHPERYGFLSSSGFEKLKEHGCKFQLNLFSLTGFYGSLPQKNAISLLKKSYYDYAATDIHSLNYRSLYKSFFIKSDLQETVNLLMRQNMELWRV